MRCPNCSNEISLEETFCGQCGTPVIFSAKHADPTNRQGLLSSGYYSTNFPASNIYTSDVRPSSNNQSSMMPSDTQQQNGFHQDPTQAMSALSSNQVQNYPTMYPQQNYGNSSIQWGYSGTGQSIPQMQPLQRGNYTGTLYPPTQTYPTGQSYGMPPGFTPPPPKKRSNIALIIISICITMALIAILAFGATLLVRTNNSTNRQLSHQNATATSVPTPTLVPSPSPTPTPSPTPSPTPTFTPTPTPDAGFALCDTTCRPNGFSVEYPNGWTQNTTADSTGTQFTNPAQSDEFAAFKTPGATTNNAGQLVNTDLGNYASQPGYNAPIPSSNATIGGENWSYQIAYYQLNNQTTRIEVYATVHQGKAYIIELQAIDSQFDMVNTQYFERMLGRFQFQ
ncbi:MAG: zinc-ribbon domain-containing protein [Ktedonobacteraceae bacterium]